MGEKGMVLIRGTPTTALQFDNLRPSPLSGRAIAMMLAFLLIARGLLAQGQQDSLTLDAALALARTHRGQVTVAAAAVAAARADRRALLSLPNPIVSYQYTGDPPRQHATVDQPLDWLLRRGSDAAAGRAGIGVALADSAALLAGVTREARTAFYAALGATRRLALATEEAAYADSLATIAARRRAAGEISALEEGQATLEAARARQLVSASREEHALAVAELGRALGVPPETLSAPAGPLDRELSASPPAPPSIDSLPMVAAARADSTMTRAAYHAARWSRVPFPAVQAGVEWGDPNDPNVGSTIVLGISLPLPLWQSGGGAAAGARARADQSAARLQETRADANRLLTQAAARVAETARRALVARDSILPLATRQRELALAAYRAGETGIVPVLDALRGEREVVRDLVNDLVAYQAARADWLALIGASE
jgi:cobalt-zinc-cadmium efflux system outer membrane protein